MRLRVLLRTIARFWFFALKKAGSLNYSASWAVATHAQHRSPTIRDRTSCFMADMILRLCLQTPEAGPVVLCHFLLLRCGGVTPKNMVSRLQIMRVTRWVALDHEKRRRRENKGSPGCKPGEKIKQQSFLAAGRP